MSETAQLVRALDERVFERAESDPEWRRQFVEDPFAAVGDMPEAQQLREMYGSPSPTGEQPEEAAMGVADEEYAQLERSLTDKVMERATSDPQWRKQLLDAPEAAMREAGFPELQRLDEMREEDVEGHLIQAPVGLPAGALPQGAFDYGSAPTRYYYYYRGVTDRGPAWGA